MKAKGIISMPYSDGSGNGLSHNKGFTLPANIGELGDDITALDLRYCSLTGPLSTRSERLMFATENMRCCAGPPLPEALKLLAPLANIEELSLGGNMLGGKITADAAVFTKLNSLHLSNMGLDGKIGSTRTERFDRRE